MSKGWDSTALKKLKALTGKGLSTSEIGKRLGMSKNAIVGKLNRLGWNAKAGGANAAALPDAKPAKAKKTAEVTKKAAATKKTESVKKVVDKAPKKTNAKAKTVVKKETEKQPVVKEVAEPKKTAKDLAVHQRIIQHSLELASLKPNQCRWPIGDPDSEHFHFCGETVFVGKPYCYEHCKQAYQFAPPKKK